MLCLAPCLSRCASPSSSNSRNNLLQQQHSRKNAAVARCCAWPMATTSMELAHSSASAFLLANALVVVDPWAPGASVNSQSIATQLFAASLFPYLGFLYHLTKSNTAPKMTLFGFYFLLAFVAATIPAGIYAKVHYGTSLSNVDWLHGGAESLLTVTNLLIVLGLRKALREKEQQE